MLYSINFNKYLQDDLIRINEWNSSVKDAIILNNGSIQKISSIPNIIKETYKISWDLSMKHLIDQAADRGIYVCQSQSLNLFVESPNFKILSSMHFYGWKRGLKTGMYYLRTRRSSKALQFTVEPEKGSESCSA